MEVAVGVLLTGVVDLLQMPSILAGTVNNFGNPDSDYLVHQHPDVRKLFIADYFRLNSFLWEIVQDLHACSSFLVLCGNLADVLSRKIVYFPGFKWVFHGPFVKN